MKKVGICVPTLNRTDMLRECLSSIHAQTYTYFTVYISCGKHMKKTREIIEEYKSLVPFVIVDRGLDDSASAIQYKLVNKALSSGSNYITIVHDDDMILPEFIEECVSNICCSEVFWVYTWGRTFGEESKSIHVDEMPTLEDMIIKNYLHHWIFAKRELFEKVNFRNEEVPWFDWDLWLRVFLNKMSGAIIEKELYLYRVHNHNQEMDDPKALYKYVLELNNLSVPQ